MQIVSVRSGTRRKVMIEVAEIKKLWVNYFILDYRDSSDPILSYSAMRVLRSVKFRNFSKLSNI